MALAFFFFSPSFFLYPPFLLSPGFNLYSAQVRQAANASLKKFGEVIHNPEIKALVPTLLKALVDPTGKTSNALTALLNTSFSHFIDSPSLALVAPIIERGLRERSASSKKKAVQILGNLSSLTDSKDFTPYRELDLPLVGFFASNNFKCLDFD